MENSSSVYFDKSCRVCLEISENMTLINVLQENHDLKSFLALFGLSMPDDQRFPNSICQLCTNQLNKMIEFRQICERSYQFVCNFVSKLAEAKTSPIADKSTNIEENINDCDTENGIKKEEIAEDDNFLNDDSFDADSEDLSVIKKEEIAEDDNFLNDNSFDEDSEDLSVITPKKRSYNRTCHDSRPYQCSYCKKSFSWRKVLVNHLRIHTGETPFECGICNKQFGASSALAYHRKRVHEKIEQPSNEERQKYFCTDCKKYFTLQSSLNIHRKKYHSEMIPIKTTCLICGHAVNNIYSHKKNKHSVPEFKCPLCNKAFPYKSGLMKHVEYIHEKSAVSFKCLCTECGKAFRTNGELKLHTKVKHSDERNYQCKFCDRRFKTSSHTLQHEKSAHLDERSYLCSYCPKAFTTKRILISHVRTHTGEKPYVCNICSRAFTQNGALKTHTRLVHGSTL